MLLIFLISSLLLPEYVCYQSLDYHSLSANLEILQSAAQQRSSKATTVRYECVPNVITVCPTGDGAPVSSFVDIVFPLTSLCFPITDSVVGGKKRTWLEMYDLCFPLPYHDTQRPLTSNA